VINLVNIKSYTTTNAGQAAKLAAKKRLAAKKNKKAIKPKLEKTTAPKAETTEKGE